MNSRDAKAIDGLVTGLVDSFLPGFAAGSLIEEDWRRTLTGPGPDLRSRLLAGAAASAALGRTRILALHAGAARTAGVPAAELSETLLFLVPYCGWAVALNALSALGGAEGGAGVGPARAGSPGDPLAGLDREALRKLGHETARAVNPQFEKVAERLGAADPGLLDHLVETAYGAVYARPGLDLRVRELVAVALLTVSGHEPQLKYHVRGALNVGASVEEVREIIAQMHLLAGWPASLAGLEAMDSVVASRKGTHEVR